MKHKAKGSLGHWEREAAAVLHAYLTSHRITIKRLTHLLEVSGRPQPAKSINNRITRGQFSFAFFLRCMRALEKTEVRLPLPELSEDDRALIARDAAHQRRRAPPRKKKTKAAES